MHIFSVVLSYSKFQINPSNLSNCYYALINSCCTIISISVHMTVDEWCLHVGWLCHLSAAWSKDRHRLLRRMLHMAHESTILYSKMPSSTSLSSVTLSGSENKGHHSNRTDRGDRLHYRFEIDCVMPKLTDMHFYIHT